MLSCMFNWGHGKKQNTGQIGSVKQILIKTCSSSMISTHKNRPALLHCQWNIRCRCRTTWTLVILWHNGSKLPNVCPFVHLCWSLSRHTEKQNAPTCLWAPAQFHCRRHWQVHRQSRPRGQWPSRYLQLTHLTRPEDGLHPLPSSPLHKMAALILSATQTHGIRGSICSELYVSI